MILSTHLFCLLNLSTTPTLCPPLILSYTFDVLNHIHQHNQPNTIRYLLCIMRDLLCTIYYVLCVIYYALCTIYYALFTMHYALCTMHYSLYTMYYALCTMHTYLYVFIRIYYFIRIHTYSYVFTISRGNPAKSRDFGTHAQLSSRRVTLPTGPKSADH